MAALQDMSIAGWLGSQDHYKREDLVALLQSGSNFEFTVKTVLYLLTLGVF
jgi:hypothetical protein